MFDNKPAPDPTTLGVPAWRGATNQQARPVPNIIGRQKVGVTWISDPFGEYSQDATSNGKGGGSAGKNWFCHIAALVCVGPADAFWAMYFNGNLVWGNPTGRTPLYARSGVDSQTFQPTFNGSLLGTVRLYWGTETQPIDPLLAGNTTHLLNDNTVEANDTTVPILHSAYRGFCYIVFESLSLGFNQTSLPNVEVVIARYPKPAWWNAEANPSASQFEANPVMIAADWLQNPRSGLGIADALLDTDGLSQTAIRLQDEGLLISAMVDREQPAKDMLVNLCDYCDGYPFLTDSGLFSIGLRRPLDSFSSALSVGEAHFAERPQLDPEDWSQVAGETRLTFRNAIYDLTDDYVVYRSPGNRLINDQMQQPTTIDRPWVTDRNLARVLVRAAGVRNSVPPITGSLKLRRLAGEDDIFFSLPVGALFTLDYPERNLAHLLFRVTERSVDDPSIPEFQITFAADLSYIYPAPSADGGTEEDPPAPPPPPPPLPPLAFVRFVELPLALCPGGRPAIAILAARNDNSLTGCAVYLGRNYEGSWP